MKEDKERTPLRTILTNFLNHIDTLENQRTPDNTYESEFQELKLFSESIKGTKQYSCSEGEKEVNRKKNRYKDILPFDVSRVILNEYAGVPGSDYINANYIKGASGSPAYIASQGPLPNTVNDFWRMVVQCEVQVIVMACNEEEAGKHKCENYWVEGEGEEKQFGMVSLRLIKASTVCPDFSVRTMRLKYTNTQSNTEERTVCQFHYSAWPDHGVPPLVRPLLDMVRLVRDTQASETLPVLIHCSAGCGRTGTICAIDYVWGLLRAGKLTNDFSLLTLVREMRRQRVAMVQTKEQYVLVHQAVRELFKEQLRMIDSHPYENIDCNGLPLIKCPSPEPTFDTITTFHTEEKMDDKEKEVAPPPLPQKKRFQALSSKQAKEVENLSERQRLVEKAGSSSESVAAAGNRSKRPCIAALRSLFEGEGGSRQVARTHSTHPGPAEARPALPVKRSKSLRVGDGSRGKLSVPPDLNPRRLSLESNLSDAPHQFSDTPHQLSDYLSVDSVVAGLGVRERRNSFRQAVRREGPGLLRSYTSVDMRSAREKPEMSLSKPLLRPKPNPQPQRTQFLNKSQVQASSSRTLTSQAMSLRLAPKTKREDCRTLLSSAVFAQSEHVYSSSESTKSASSDQGPSNSKSTTQSPSRHTLPLTRPLTVTSKHKIRDIEDKAMQPLFSPTNHQSIFSPRRHNENIVRGHRQDVNSHPSILSKEQNQITRNQGIVSQPTVGRSEQTPDKSKPIGEARKLSSQAPVVYDSKNFRQNSTPVYGSVKVPPPPYVEPSKTAQKPRSSTQHVHSKGFVDDLYGKTPDQRLYPIIGSSRDMVLPNRKPLIGTDVRLNMPEASGMKYSRNLSDTRQKGQDFRVPVQNFNSNSVPPEQHVYFGERRRQDLEVKNEQRADFQDHLKTPTELLSKTALERRHIEQTMRTNHPVTNTKSKNDKRYQGASFEQDPVTKNISEKREPDMRQDAYYRGLDERRLAETEFRHNTQESVSKGQERRQTEAMSPQVPMTHPNERVAMRGNQDPFSKTHNYPVNPQELYVKLSSERGRPVDQDARATYMSKNSQAPLSPRTPQSSAERPINETQNTTPGAGGMRVRRGSRDDLALCATTPARVKRHASVVLLRNNGPANTTPLSVWGGPGAETSKNQTQQTPFKDDHDAWSGAVGVDLDQVAASITNNKDDKMMRSALEALHLRKASQVTPKTTPASHKTNQQTPKSHQVTPKTSQPTQKLSHSSLKQTQLASKMSPLTGNLPPDSSKPQGHAQFQSPPEVSKPGPFRKQQQYL